jgi:hypothetical protein
MLKILRYLLCVLTLVSAPSFAAVIFITGNDLQSGLLAGASASIDPHAYLSKYDYSAASVAPNAGDTIVVLPLSTVPEPSSVLMVMLGLGIMGMAAHKQSEPF